MALSDRLEDLYDQLGEWFTRGRGRIVLTILFLIILVLVVAYCDAPDNTFL